MFPCFLRKSYSRRNSDDLIEILTEFVYIFLLKALVFEYSLQVSAYFIPQRNDSNLVYTSSLYTYNVIYKDTKKQ